MGKWEVTQEEYEAVMGVNPSSWRGPTKPVNMVSWSDAVAYCAALTEQERAAGRLPAHCVYRLPTEAEWEYACRAGTTTRFSYGDDPGYANLEAYAWYGDNSILTPYPVGPHPEAQKLPNPWGLYDMPGNVWEWCHDWLAYYSGGTAVDPQEGGGPRITDLSRTVRGGVWFGSAEWCRSAARSGIGGGSEGWADVGFRIVLAPSQP
jgi:formylglycine-generating enzyme required for sulfatase activity